MSPHPCYCTCHYTGIGSSPPCGDCCRKEKEDRFEHRTDMPGRVWFNGVEYMPVPVVHTGDRALLLDALKDL